LTTEDIIAELFHIADLFCPLTVIRI